jgi:ATP-dependent DNA helicase RecG
MTIGLAELLAWMSAPEHEHLEFKEARNRFSFEELVKYCCALANEGGGRIILGVSDQQPRRIVGTRAFENPGRTKLGLVERLHLRVDVIELEPPEGRVLVFEVPGRPIGMPIQYEGAYWMRAGESLTPMTPDLLKRIFAEAEPDFSAQVCDGAELGDLDPAAIATFRSRWIDKSRRSDLADMAPERLLEDAELLVKGKVTYAALILFGTYKALGRHLAQSEVIFEYRSDEASIPYQQRKEYREGFLLFHDDLWATINLRNETFSYQDGLFRRDIPALNEKATREAVLNAVSHRDYRLAGSTFVKQWPTKIEITSPGGFPPEITPENILFRQSPRNRRIAEALAKCGFVERSGQGADRMYQESLREGKLPPDFSGSDPYHVVLTFFSKVQDEAFVRYLDLLGKETQHSFGVEDLLVLDAVHRERPIPAMAKDRVRALVAVGALERLERNRLVLAQRYYLLAGQAFEYTRRRGLDRETKKALLVKHVERSGAVGVPFDELARVLPAEPKERLKVLLRELKRAGRVRVVGRTRAARWFGVNTPGRT